MNLHDWFTWCVLGAFIVAMGFILVWPRKYVTRFYVEIDGVRHYMESETRTGDGWEHERVKREPRRIGGVDVYP